MREHRNTPYDVQHNGRWYCGVVNTEGDTTLIRVGKLERRIQIIPVPTAIEESILEMIRELDAQGELTDDHLSAAYLDKLK